MRSILTLNNLSNDDLSITGVGNFCAKHKKLSRPEHKSLEELQPFLIAYGP